MNAVHLQNSADAEMCVGFDTIRTRRGTAHQCCLYECSLSWKGLAVERHKSGAGERAETLIDHPVISMLCATPSVVEYRGRGGGFVSRIKMPETITIHPIGEVPKVVCRTPSEFVHIALNRAFVQEVFDELGHRAGPPQEFTTGLIDSAMAKLIRLLIEEADATMPTGGMYVEMLAHALVLRYGRCDTLLTDWDRKEKLQPLPRAIFNRVKDKMEANLDTNLRVAEIAREAGYSRCHFIQMFRASAGMTPHKFLIQLRIEHAKRLLRKSDLRLTDIALACGFSSHAHMSHVFRQTLGVVPAELRRRQFE